MRYRYICDDCDHMVKDELDLDTKPNGTPCCPNCGSTHIDVWGFLYGMDEVNVKVEKVKTSDTLKRFKETIR